MRAVTFLLLSFMIVFSLSASLYQVRADSSASNICGSGQTCTIKLSSNPCICNSTPYVTITSVHWTSTNRTLGFTADGASGSTATTNISIPKAAVLNQNSANIKAYVKGVLLPSSQVTIKMNSTYFFTAFDVSFASPVSAAISLGIISGASTFPAASLALLTLLLAAALPHMRGKQSRPR